MFKLRLFVTGIDEAIARAGLLERLFLHYTAHEMEWFGSKVSSEAKTDHPYQDRTGELTRSIGYTVESWGNGKATVLVFATAPYADAVEHGTTNSRPYPFIWPKFYQYLPELYKRLQEAVDRAFVDAIAQTAGP